MTFVTIFHPWAQPQRVRHGRAYVLSLGWVTILVLRGYDFREAFDPTHWADYAAQLQALQATLDAQERKR